MLCLCYALHLQIERQNLSWLMFNTSYIKPEETKMPFYGNYFKVHTVSDKGEWLETSGFGPDFLRPLTWEDHLFTELHITLFHFSFWHGDCIFEFQPWSGCNSVNVRYHCTHCCKHSPVLSGFGDDVLCTKIVFFFLDLSIKHFGSLLCFCLQVWDVNLTGVPFKSICSQSVGPF
jgi:hypothetical protein